MTSCDMYVAVIPHVIFVADFFLTFVMKRVNKHIGRKWDFSLSCLTAVIGCAGIYIGGIHSPDGNTKELYGVVVVDMMLWLKS